MVNEIEISYNFLFWYKEDETPKKIPTVSVYINAGYFDEVKVYSDTEGKYIIVNSEKMYLKTLKKL
jgi:hypothetical protein